MTKAGAAWTRRDDDRLRRDWAKDLPVPRIAQRLGRTPRSVSARAAVLCLPRRITRWGAGEDRLLRELWTAGAPAEAIAEAVRRTPAAVFMRAQALGLTRRKAA